MGTRNRLRESFSENKVKEKLASGDFVITAPEKLHSPTVVELYGDIGLDCAFIDFEHCGPSPWDSTHLENLQRAADVSGTELLVRIPEVNEALIRKVLDTGVRNILLPRVKTADEVRRAITAARFGYDGGPGERGIGGGRANMWENFDEDEDYIRREDETVVVGAIIETEAAVENIDDILAVPGLGFILVGHVDLALSLGHSQKPGADIRYPHDNPAMQELVGTIIDKARERDVPYGKVPSDKDDALEAIEEGYQILSLTMDLDAIREEFEGWVDALRKPR